MKEYFHRKPGEEAHTVPWPCRVAEECRISCNGRELLYVIADALVGSSCVGAGSLRYIQVHGFIQRWHYRHDEDGNPVSAVDPVDEALRAVIQKTLADRHRGLQVCF